MDPENTSVLVLLVATNGEPWLREVIEAIRNQTHDDLTVIAVDNASTDGSRKLLEKAFGRESVVVLERRVGYGRALAAALKVVADREMPADAFLLLHDDAVMDPGSVEAMLDALAHERVGIVGAKLVEYDRPDALQEVGLTTDRFGRLYNPLEPGELDQGQHDGLKEVLFSSSACMLVAREVVERVGLLDLRYVALRDDFDFCWRARLGGFRSVVTSGARVRHAIASYRDLRPGFVTGRVRYFSERNMIASLIKNYSLRSLIVALPVTLVISILNTILFAVTGRRHHAGQTLSALQWNLVHLPSTLRARARAQRRRRSPDSDVLKFMARGVPRVRSHFERALEQVVGEPAAGIEEAEGLALSERSRPKLIDRVRAHPVGISLAVVAVLYLFGARSLFGDGGLAGADLAPFPPRAGDFFTEFFSGWRSGGTGGAAPASPFLFIAGLVSMITFGSVRIAERLLVLSLVPLSGAAAWKAAGAIGIPTGARRVAAAAYALSPLTLAAFFQGRFPELVLVAALPVLILPLLRTAGFAPDVRWRSLVSGALGLAAVTTVTPWAPVAVFVAGITIAIGGVALGERRAPRAAVLGSVMPVAAVVVLLPWSLELFRAGSPVGSRPGPFGAPMTDLVRLVPAGPFPIPPPMAWAFPVAAAAGVVLAGPERRRIARLLAVVGTLALLLSWAVSRGVPWIAPRPGLPLVLSAVCAALLAGMAAEGLGPSLRARSFGAPHVALAGVGAFGIASMLVGVALIAGGSFDGLHRAGDLEPSFFTAETATFGDFRILWLDGDLRSLRADLTAPEGETMLTFGSRRHGPGEDYLEGILASVLARTTEQGGRLLAPAAVRYVVLRPGIDGEVVRAFARQTDLRFAQRFQGSQVLSNEAWLPVAGGVKSPDWVAASVGEPERPLLAAAPEDPGRSGSLHRVRPGVLAGRIGVDVGSVFLGEEFSDDWRLRAGGRVVPATRSFGWANAFAVGDASGPIVVSWDGQGWHRAALLGQALMLALIGAAWSRRSAGERGER